MVLTEKRVQFTNLDQPHLYGDSGWQFPSSDLQEGVSGECKMDSFVIFDGAHRLSLSCVSGPVNGKTARELFYCPVDKEWATALNRAPRFSAEVIYCHEEPRILKKITDSKFLAWDELYMLAKLAEMGKPSAIAAVAKPLSALIGKGEFNRTSESLFSLQRVLPLLERFWPDEWVHVLSKVHKTVLPWIMSSKDTTYYGSGDPFFGEGLRRALATTTNSSNPEGNAETRLRDHARKIVGQISKLALGGIQKRGSERLTDFFLKEIVQKPNPENAAVIRDFIVGFDGFPLPFRQKALRYFRDKYDIAVSAESAFGYPGACPVFSDILVFLYRKTGRKDARLELENQMLQELAFNETHALSLYLKELVAKDRDAAAILRLKEMLIGRSPLATGAAPLLLRELLSAENGVFFIFEAFLTGKEAIEVVQNGVVVKKRFNIGSFFASTEPFVSLPASDSRSLSMHKGATLQDPDAWGDYQSLIYLTMQRASLSKEPTKGIFFSAIQTHFDRFYSDLDNGIPPWSEDQPPWSPWRSSWEGFFSPLIAGAMAHAPMRDYLRHKVRQGDPFLGYEALARSYGEFRSIIHAEPLDAVYERALIELKLVNRDPDWFPMMIGRFIDMDEISTILHTHDQNLSEQFLLRGLDESDPKIRYAFLSLAAAAHIQTPRLRQRLSEIDLSFIQEMAARHAEAGYDPAPIAHETESLLKILEMSWNHPSAAEIMKRLTAGH